MSCFLFSAFVFTIAAADKYSISIYNGLLTFSAPCYHTSDSSYSNDCSYHISVNSDNCEAPILNELRKSNNVTSGIFSSREVLQRTKWIINCPNSAVNLSQCNYRVVYEYSDYPQALFIIGYTYIITSTVFQSKIYYFFTSILFI